MISEPELVGEEQPLGDAEIPRQHGGGADAADTDAADSAMPETIAGTATGVPAWRSRPAWVWALGGALVASALWAGGVYAYKSRDPDLGGYRVSRNLCLETELKALSTAIGKVESRTPMGREHTSLDVAYCWAGLTPSDQPAPKPDENGPEAATAEVYFTYELHKKTDPGPEFDAGVGMQGIYGDEGVRLERVEGLGERAYFVLDDTSDDVPTLHVLDGQAVLTLDVQPVGPDDTDGETPHEDLSGIRPFMIEDMRDLMAKLRS
ncbi:hypothetical protein [Streptomyces sp. NPDC005408]|uniref:hypothetical protein n=1 Tax=Streptomyces sp. NPDC005408 TaxID=3155341 RepID=UPI0033B967D5